MAEFDTPADAMHAAEQVRDAGFTRWDVHTPYPVHGMDDAMGWGIPRSAGLRFAAACPDFWRYAMIWYMNAYDYGIPVGGKPNFSPFASFPVAYEMTILFGAFGSLFGMLFLNKLLRLHHPLLKNLRFADVTHDKFFVVIEADDPKYEEEETLRC